MKQIIKIVSVSITILLLVFASCSVAFAAPDSYYPIASDKPTVTDYSGYVELLFQNKSTGSRFVTVVSWFFTPISTSVNSPSSDKPVLTIVRNQSQFRLGVSSQTGVAGNMSFLSIDSGSQLYFYNLPVPDDSATYYYPVTYGSDYSLVGMHYYGDFSSVEVSNALSNEEFYVTYAEDSVLSYGLNQIISALYSLVEITGDNVYKDQLDSILESLNSFSGSFDEFEEFYKSKMTLLFSYCEDYFQQLKSLVETSDEILSYIQILETYISEIRGLFEQLYWLEMDSNGKLYEIKDTLDAILAVLNSKSDTEFTTVNQNEFNSYYDVENSLLNPDIDVSDVMNVEVNQNALTVIWDLVERGLQSHGKVFGMVLTILALGIVALVLGR